MLLKMDLVGTGLVKVENPQLVGENPVMGFPPAYHLPLSSWMPISFNCL